MTFDFDLLSDKDSTKKMLTIAFGKGRGFKESLAVLNLSHSKELKMFADGLVPVYIDHIKNLKLVKVRNKDLPWLLIQEHVDIAFGSSVWFDEFSDSGLQLYSELPFMKCRISVIASRKIALSNIRSICSKFSNIAKKYMDNNQLHSKLIVMEGCHEVALSLGITDAIIDIIETGKTIERMKFFELDCIKTITHGLWIREKDEALKMRLSASIDRKVSMKLVPPFSFELT